MTIREQAIAGIKWTAGGRLAAQAITWGITLIVMRLLHPEDYGLLAMATVFLAFMLMLSEAGLAPALVQKQELSNTALQQIFAIIIIINLALCVILNLLAPLIAEFFDDERLISIIRVLSLQFFTVIAITIPQALLYRELKFKQLSLIDFIAAIIGSLATLILAYLNYGVWSLIYGSLLVNVYKMVAFNILTPFYIRPKFSLDGMRSFLTFGGNITLTRVLWYFYNQVDVIIVGKVLGKEILGYYSVAMYLASLPVQRISSVIGQVAFPIFTKVQEDQLKFRNFVLKSIRILSLIAFPVLWGISSIAYELVSLFLGEKWLTAVLPLQLLTLVMPFRVIANFLPSATDALGHPEIALKNVLLSAVLMPIALLIGVQWGITGVALVWVTFFPIILFINYYRSLGVIGLSLKDLLHVLFPIMASGIGMYLVVWGVDLLLGNNLNKLLELAIMIISGALVYYGLTIKFNKAGYLEFIQLFRKN